MSCYILPAVLAFADLLPFANLPCVSMPSCERVAQGMLACPISPPY